MCPFLDFANSVITLNQYLVGGTGMIDRRRGGIVHDSDDIQNIFETHSLRWPRQRDTFRVSGPEQNSSSNILVKEIFQTGHAEISGKLGGLTRWRLSMVAAVNIVQRR